MAYDAKAQIGVLELGNKGLVVTVCKDGATLGHLMIGKANVVWFDKSKKKKGHKVPWADLEAWIMANYPEVTATRP